VCIGADFLQAMLATAPGQKLLTGRHPAATFFFASLFFCRKLHFFLGKSTKKLLPPGLHFLTPICTKLFVRCGLCRDPTGVAYCAPQAPKLYLAGLLEGTGEEERRGSCPKKKKDVGAYECMG